MAGDSSISWTDKTWNPLAGCSIVSAGCTNCYAMKMAHRINRMKPDPASHYFDTTKVVNGNAVWTGVVNPAPEHILLAPLSWKKPARIFVNSMSDLFHEAVPDEVIDNVFAVMALCPQHTFQVLTKRSKRMRKYMSNLESVKGVSLGSSARNADIRIMDGALCPWPLSNVHLGVSCEDQTRADERVPDLLATPAAVRFVSAEPLLSGIDFTNLPYESGRYIDALAGTIWTPGAGSENSFTTKCRKIDHIIVGGESGPGHRPMQIEWAESIRQQCADAGTAFFFKQDSGPRAGMQGRASNALWACKQFPKVK